MLNKLHIILKRIVFSNFFVRSLGSKFLFKFFFKKDTVIFLFHEVTNNPSEFHTKYSLNVCPELFEDQIKIIKRQFNAVSPETLLEGNYNRPAAVITFDDGSRRFYFLLISYLKIFCKRRAYVMEVPRQL